MAENLTIEQLLKSSIADEKTAEQGADRLEPYYDAALVNARRKVLEEKGSLDFTVVGIKEEFTNQVNNQFYIESLREFSKDMKVSYDDLVKNAGTAANSTKDMILREYMGFETAAIKNVLKNQKELGTFMAAMTQQYKPGLRQGFLSHFRKDLHQNLEKTTDANRLAFAQKMGADKYVDDTGLSIMKRPENYLDLGKLAGAYNKNNNTLTRDLVASSSEKIQPYLIQN